MVFRVSHCVFLISLFSIAGSVKADPGATIIQHAKQRDSNLEVTVREISRVFGLEMKKWLDVTYASSLPSEFDRVTPGVSIHRQKIKTRQEVSHTIYISSRRSISGEPICLKLQIADYPVPGTHLTLRFDKHRLTTYDPDPQPRVVIGFGPVYGFGDGEVDKSDN